MSNLEDYIKSNGNLIKVKVITKSSENKIIVDDDIIKIKTREIPESGKANNSIISIISDDLKINKSKIKILKGATNSIKLISIQYNNS